MKTKQTKFLNKFSIKNITIKHGLIILYVAILIGGYYFVDQALKDDSFSIQKEEKEKAKQEEKPIRVTLSVVNGRTNKTFQERMNNTQSVLDLIDALRQKGELKYEMRAYTYGTEIYTINGLASNDEYKWKVFMKSSQKDVSDQIDNLNLAEEDILMLNKTINKEYEISLETEHINLVNNSEITIKYVKVENEADKENLPLIESTIQQI